MNCECGGPVVLDPARGEYLCEVCGLVAQAGIIDAQPAYADPSANVRSSWRPPSQEAAQRMRHLEKIDSRVVSNKDRSEKRLRSAVRELAVRAKVSEMEERVFVLAHKAVGSGGFRGWEFGLVAGGALYFALMEAHGKVNRRTFLPLVLSSSERTKCANVRKVYRALKRLTGSQPRIATAGEIAREIALRLELSGETLRLAQRNLEVMPPSTAAWIDAGAAVYLACVQVGAQVSQKRIAEACGTNDVSLRSRLKTFKYSREHGESR